MKKTGQLTLSQRQRKKMSLNLNSMFKNKEKVKAMYDNLVDRFIKYVKIETRSDETSQTVPSTQSQVEFAKVLMKDLKEVGLSEVEYNDDNGFVTATLEANVESEVPTVGFIAHMDTADFNAENVNPQFIEIGRASCREIEYDKQKRR